MGALRSCFARTGTWQQAGKYVSALVSDRLAPRARPRTVPGTLRTGQLRFFLINGIEFGEAGGTGATATAIDSWVSSACTQVPVKDYSTSTAIAAVDIGTLYACRRNA